MSLHMDCKKCGKYLGGIWPEGLTEEEIDDFFRINAQSVCDYKKCPYRS